MIFNLIYDLFYTIASGMISGIGTIANTSPAGYMVHFADLVNKGLYFFPTDVWVSVLGCIVSWAVIHLSFGLYRMVKGLIPFV